MRRMMLKVLSKFLIALFFLGSLQAQGTEQKIAQAQKKLAKGPEGRKLAIGKFSLTTPDINVFMKGRIREEYFNLNKFTTLRDDYFDDLDMCRHKFSFYFYAIQGLQRYGKASSEAYMKLTNYSFWQKDGYYVHLTEEDIKISPDEPDKEVRLMDDHTHTLMVPVVFMEDVWFKVNFGTFNTALKDNPIDLKVGYFEYQLGRGLTLGTYYDVGVRHLGWTGPGGATHFPHSPPGILLRSKICSKLHLDLYYTLWTETNCHPKDPRKMTHTPLLKDTRTERGVTNDQQSWTVKFDFDHDDKRWGNFHVEPYFMWTRAPEQGIEFKADASSRLGTVGAMAEYKHKGWTFNVEGALQFGHQDVYAIDRNVIELERDRFTGKTQEVYSHVYYNLVTGVSDKWGPYYVDGKAPVTKNLAKVVYSETNRKVEQNGKQIAGVKVPVPDKIETAVEKYKEYDVYNSNLLGFERFRKAFKIDYEGFMALVDLSYESEKWHLKPAVMAAYISGDDYPYNYPYQNRNYKGFVTLRDQNYFGREVESYAILEGRILPRPLNVAYFKAYAYNHDADASNLQMFGGGLTWWPFKRKEKLFFNFNVIGFWNTKSVYKWDKNGEPSLEDGFLVGDNTTRNVPNPTAPTDMSKLMTEREFHQLIVKAALGKLNIEGWQATHKASSHIGTEFNAKVQMHFLGSFEWRLRGLIFIPGSLYKDLKGQPNRNTRHVKIKDGEYKKFYQGLGDSTVWGIHTSLTYRF